MIEIHPKQPIHWPIQHRNSPFEEVTCTTVLPAIVILVVVARRFGFHVSQTPTHKVANEDLTKTFCAHGSGWGGPGLPKFDADHV